MPETTEFEVILTCPLCRAPEADHIDDRCKAEYEDDEFENDDEAMEAAPDLETQLDRLLRQGDEDEAGIAQVRIDEPDRFCRFCGADVIGNDPCAPGCPAE